ncbi:MAG: hypothetical protein JNL74_23290 [Fibrobacteres bacterium]|nr:hypothetical protein [Fibrobacterota bacterium]
MRILCLLCDFETDDDGQEIISHITENHGGLEGYLSVFPFAPVVNAGIESAIMNNDPLPESVKITDTDKSILAAQYQQLAPLRSEITVEA